MMISIDTSEVDRLADMLGDVGMKVAAGAPPLLGQNAERIATIARSAAPVLTGELRDSITVSGAGMERTVGSDVRQAFYQEFGTSVMPPQPWLTPAVEAGLPLLEDGLGELGALW